MKTTSSSTASRAKAVCSRGESFSRRLHRARTQEPAEENPIPTPSAATRLTGNGQPCSTLVTSNARLPLLIIAAITSTRAWPTRSIAWPHSGATTAAVRVLTAATSPARPNDPLVSEISSTMPSPVIDRGSRATRPGGAEGPRLRVGQDLPIGPQPGRHVLPLLRKVPPVNDHPPARTRPLDPYDAVLLVSFGGPEGPEEVLPFLENVTRGRGIPRERLAEVGEHYYLFGGRSPINEQCRMLLAALDRELSARGLAVPLFWGNRNSAPFLADEVRAIEAAGHRRVLAVVTSAYPSYSSCRQYRENLYDAAAGTVGADRPDPALRRPPGLRRRLGRRHPGRAATGWAGPGSAARLVFVTHSIPAHHGRDRRARAADRHRGVRRLAPTRSPPR